MLHQMPLKALRNISGWESCSTLYMHRLLASIRISTMNGGNDLIAFFIQYRSDDIEGIIPGVQAEQMEDPCHPQHPEDDHAGQEEKG